MSTQLPITLPTSVVTRLIVLLERCPNLHNVSRIIKFRSDILNRILLDAAEKVLCAQYACCELDNPQALSTGVIVAEYMQCIGHSSLLSKV